MNPPAAGVVSVAYRRVFDRIVVSTRVTGEELRRMAESFARI